MVQNELTKLDEALAPQGLQEVLINRQAQEVQAAIVIAKRFPRNELDAINKIRKACLRKDLAEQAEYSYPRGGEKVEGPSIRLAEVIAQNWGNIDYGEIELGRNNGHSEMMAYAWDLETNTRRTKVFTVKHEREKKSGNVALKDGRDIYEHTANMGARRVRACILAIIPGDVVDSAVETCRKTLTGSYTEPLRERLKNMTAIMDDKFRVTVPMIEEFFGFKLDAMSENDFTKLGKIHNSLRDGMSKREDWFKVKQTAASSLDPTAPKTKTTEGGPADARD